VDALRQLILAGWKELPEPALNRVLRFYECILEENRVQNLTRLVEAEQFWNGFVQDVKALFESKLVAFPAMDLGSGAGVPGLLAAAISDEPWILVDSEKSKARFMEKTAKALGVRARVYGERGEDVLKKASVQSIVCKAVGPVGRIYGWLRACSTWNNLVLLKGPAWDSEWTEFSAGCRELVIAARHDYVVAGVQRVIVRLNRVPRGTS
jgi:16S rRNA (guanine527-N7)-methyltransferase